MTAVCAARRQRALGGSSFSSPNVRVAFDSVRVLPETRVAFRRRKDGFTLEVAVPLKALAWTPVSGATLRGDVGVIYGDDTGARNILRSSGANRNTTLTADVGEDARLTPAEWGEIRVE